MVHYRVRGWHLLILVITRWPQYEVQEQDTVTDSPLEESVNTVNLFILRLLFFLIIYHSLTMLQSVQFPKRKKSDTKGKCITLIITHISNEKCGFVLFCFVYLCNIMSTATGSFNSEFWFLSKLFIAIIIILAMFIALKYPFVYI